MSLLDRLMGPRFLNALGVPLPPREQIQVVGATVADDAVNQQTVVTVASGGGGSTPSVIVNSVSGSFTPTKATHGRRMELEVVGNVAIQVPSGYTGADDDIWISCYCAGGDWTITLASGYALRGRYDGAGKSGQSSGVLLKIGAAGVYVEWQSVWAVPSDTTPAIGSRANLLSRLVSAEGVLSAINSLVDPINVLGAKGAWRAMDAVTSGGNVTSIPCRVPGGPAMVPGATVAAPAAEAQFGGQLSVGGRYTASLTLPAISGTTLAIVIRKGDNNNHGALTATVGGTADTSSRILYYAGQIYAMNAGVAGPDASYVNDGSGMVVVAVFTAGAPARIYKSSRTPVTAGSNTGATAGNQLHIGQYNAAGGLHNAPDRWTEAHAYDRPLTQVEVNHLLQSLGNRYGIPIAA